MIYLFLYLDNMILVFMVGIYLIELFIYSLELRKIVCSIIINKRASILFTFSIA